MSIRNFSFSWSLVVISIILSLSSPTWFGAWVGMEMNLFGAVALMVGSTKLSVDSVFKYFFAQSFGSSVIIMGLVMGGWVGLGPVMACLVLGLMVKVGAAPFHFWVVEVLKGIRVECMWFLLTVQKLVPLMLVTQVGQGSWALFVCSGLSVLVGSISGVGATSLSRLVGYSSIAHTGWSLAACISGMSVLWFYLLAYWISLTGFLRFSKGDWRLSSWGGEGLASCFFLFSLGGFPPFLGFFGKLAVMVAVVGACPLLLIPLAVGSVVSWGYYLFVVSFSVIQSSLVTTSSSRLLVPMLVMSVPYLMGMHLVL
uniref:NADH-ubiquinone oxidoreductase chain 2 n=1 Tax=Argopecten irradians concentricus TaxID=158586 RepID=A0A0K2CQ21_ARGIR|nr:NADH dehydrogenase subunit 2 [Argopecten irradians concentricus]